GERDYLLPRGLRCSSMRHTHRTKTLPNPRFQFGTRKYDADGAEAEGAPVRTGRSAVTACISVPRVVSGLGVSVPAQGALAICHRGPGRAAARRWLAGIRRSCAGERLAKSPPAAPSLTDR